MYKYLRTNEGKIYVRNDLHQSKELIGNVLVDKNGWCIYPNDIIKQADTIEELCDEFVVEHKDKIHVINKTHKIALIGIWLKNKDMVYGAIWIKGSNGEPILKTVTKPMNDKGELELL